MDSHDTPPTQAQSFGTIVDQSKGKGESIIPPLILPQIANRDDDTYSSQKKQAEEYHQMHDAYMADFIASMRVRYAWFIFALIVIWLTVDIILIVASATESLNIRFVSGFIGFILGSLIGTSWGHACRNMRNSKDTKNLYRLPYQQRSDILDRNIQLRVMRSSGSVPISVICSIAGVVLFSWLGPLLCSNESSIPFRLDSTVLLMLIGTTTASVLGLFLIVLHWLFPKGNG